MVFRRAAFANAGLTLKGSKQRTFETLIDSTAVVQGRSNNLTQQLCWSRLFHTIQQRLVGGTYSEATRKCRRRALCSAPPQSYAKKEKLRNYKTNYKFPNRFTNKFEECNAPFQRNSRPRLEMLTVLFSFASNGKYVLPVLYVAPRD